MLPLPGLAVPYYYSQLLSESGSLASRCDWFRLKFSHRTGSVEPRAATGAGPPRAGGERQEGGADREPEAAGREPA